MFKFSDEDRFCEDINPYLLRYLELISTCIVYTLDLIPVSNIREANIRVNSSKLASLIFDSCNSYFKRAIRILKRKAPCPEAFLYSKLEITIQMLFLFHPHDQVFPM